MKNVDSQFFKNGSLKNNLIWTFVLCFTKYEGKHFSKIVLNN